MPLATVLIGIAVWAWRRSSENAPYVGPASVERRPGDVTSKKGPP
jgi:hypothetical protein